MTNTLSTTIKNSSLSPDMLFASANASAHFALHCLEPTPEGSMHATSSFVDPEGEAMLWHE